MDNLELTDALCGLPATEVMQGFSDTAHQRIVRRPRRDAAGGRGRYRWPVPAIIGDDPLDRLMAKLGCAVLDIESGES